MIWLWLLPIDTLSTKSYNKTTKKSNPMIQATMLLKVIYYNERKNPISLKLATPQARYLHHERRRGHNSLCRQGDLAL